MDSASRPRGSRASLSAVTTVRESTADTSIGGKRFARTVIASSDCAALAAAAGVKETSEPAPTVNVTFRRVSTIWPSLIRLTV